MPVVHGGRDAGHLASRLSPRHAATAILFGGRATSRRMRLPTLSVLALLAASALAGCSGGDGGPDAPGLDVTEATGGIRGLVVDPSIVPVAAATVTLNTGASTQSGEDGLFNFTGLAAGDYVMTVTKPGHLAVQASATVVAGEPEPPVVKVLLERISTAEPYMDFYKLDGFYECGFAYGNPGSPVITDSCDFVWRTGYDAANESTGSPPPFLPRTLQNNVNTQFIDLPADVHSVVQEAFWSDESVPVMMILLSSTPIDNACDCSDRDYLDVTMPQPTYGRLDRFDASGQDTGDVPVGERVAARGFLSWESTSTAQNLQFTVITTLFHNAPAPEGWTFETRDQYSFG